MSKKLESDFFQLPCNNSEKKINIWVQQMLDLFNLLYVPIPKQK